MSNASRTSVVSGDELLERARALVPMLRARAVATERDRRISDDVMDALIAADLFRVAQPRRYGGFALDLEFLPRIAMELAAGCASTAWVYVTTATEQWILAGFPIEAQDDLWGRDPGTLACGSFAPAGKAVAVDGGFRLSGRWGFASGCDNVQWTMLGTILPPGGERTSAAPAFLLVPARDYSIDDDWFAIGLAGTGSKTLVLDDVFVPRHRSLGFAQLLSGDTPGGAAHGDPLYRMPMLAGVPASLVSVALGAAQGALDDYIEGARGRVTRGAVAGALNRMAEFATVQLRVAEAAASVDAARTILLRDLRAVLAQLRAGGAVTVADRITARRGHAFAAKLALAAIEALNAATGANGLSIDQPVQRAWRDVNAVARHISLNWDAVGTMYGQHVLGLEPKGQY